MSNRIVYQSINCFLENSLLIAQNDVRSIDFFKLLETVIAVDHTTIKVINIRRSVAPTIKRHHRSNGWWNNRNTHQKHPLRSIAGINHPLDGTDAFIEAGNFRRRRVFKFCLELFQEFLEVEVSQNIVDCFRANPRFENGRVFYA